MSWKKLIQAKINEFFRNDLVIRITASESLCRITKIHAALHEPHILWQVCKEFPRYKSYVHLAVLLIGMLFCGKWFSSCQKCGERSNALTEHIKLYCPSADTLRYALWRRLFSGFGVKFYRQFISLSPSDQVNALLSLYLSLCHHLIK